MFVFNFLGKTADGPILIWHVSWRNPYGKQGSIVKTFEVCYIKTKSTNGYFHCISTNHNADPVLGFILDALHIESKQSGTQSSIRNLGDNGGIWSRHAPANLWCHLSTSHDDPVDEAVRFVRSKASRIKSWKLIGFRTVSMDAFLLDFLLIFSAIRYKS